MARYPQPSDGRGSLRNIQVLVNRNPALLTDKIKERLKIELSDITWVSPLKDDEYAEYRDGDFLKRLGLGELKVPLNHFWPEKGPQWDALGKGRDGEVFIVEAKANIPELLSSCEARAPKSRKRIQRRFKETREFLKCRTSIDWTTGLYQYANRLTHLYYLRHLNKINAYLIFVYFVDDTTHIPTSLKEWEGALLLEKKLLGLNKHKLSKYIAEVFIRHDP
jgi:hypothetical protein